MNRKTSAGHWQGRRCLGGCDKVSSEETPVETPVETAEKARKVAR